MKMPLSPSSSPSTSSSRPLQLHPTTPEKPSPCSSKACFRCKQQGHWVQACPFKSDSPASPNTAIQCRCGHGACVIQISKTEKNRNRKYFACPITRGARCNNGGFLKWCDDEHIDQSYFQPPPFKYPKCECGAGVCRRVMCTESPNVVKYFFTCPVKKNHGSCGYVVSEDEFLRLLNSQSIVPARQGRQRTLHDFWEGCQNDGTDHELGKGDGMLVQTKRMRIMDCSESSSSVAVSENPEEEDACTAAGAQAAVSEIPEKEDAGASVEAPAAEISEEEDAGAAVEATQAEHVGFPEFEVPDDDLEFANLVPWDAFETEALTTQSTHMFQSNIFGSCEMGWLGRLLFFCPTQSLEFPKPKPFFCCIFPSFNCIIVPKQKKIPKGPSKSNQLAINKVNQSSQHSTGFHNEVSKDVVSPNKSQESERKPISKAQQHSRDVALFTRQRLLSDLETWDPRENESMREAAETTFALLNILGVDYTQFSDHVLAYINFVTSIAEIDKSTENVLTLEEHNKLMDEEKMRLAQLQDEYVKTKALLEASNQHKQEICEEVSNLKAMLHEKETQLKSCELETLKIETRLGDLKASMLEADIALKERTEHTEVARKLNKERHAKQIAAKVALDKALNWKIDY